MYRVYTTEDGAVAIMRFDAGGFVTSFPCAPDNTDYQNFKYQINHDEAGLEDADGVLMTPEEAKAFVATLP